ncbi:MAG: hypothetical protein WCA07_13895, partial [Gloeobacterales cyanobacterium]
ITAAFSSNSVIQFLLRDEQHYCQTNSLRKSFFRGTLNRAEHLPVFQDAIWKTRLRTTIQHLERQTLCICIANLDF